MLKRLKSTQLEEEGRLAVHEIVNKMNCQHRRLEPDNAGIDGEIQLVCRTIITGKLLKHQVKAGKSYISSENRIIKLKVEKKYIELWNEMNVPVILFFYHPELKQVFWKSIQDYLRANPRSLRQQKDTILIPLDKETDLFSPACYENMLLVARGEFDYENPIYSEKNEELILTNWFPVLGFPKLVYKAPTEYRTKGEITQNLTGYYCFILKEGAIYSFSDLGDSERELSNMCDSQNVTVSYTADMLQTSKKYFMELLNSVIYINAIQNELVPAKERFYFSPKALQDVKSNTFKFTSLTGMQVSRQKIYIRGKGREYQHQAVKLKFQELGSRWFLEIEPDFYFTYPNLLYKSGKEIGIRITKQKASMYNEEYLYLLHFWKQFLSKNSDKIILPCDSTPNAQTVIVTVENLSATSPFKLLNDYHGPRKDEEQA